MDCCVGKEAETSPESIRRQGGVGLNPERALGFSRGSNRLGGDSSAPNPRKTAVSFPLVLGRIYLSRYAFATRPPTLRGAPPCALVSGRRQEQVPEGRGSPDSGPPGESGRSREARARPRLPRAPDPLRPPRAHSQVWGENSTRSADFCIVGFVCWLSTTCLFSPPPTPPLPLLFFLLP